MSKMRNKKNITFKPLKNFFNGILKFGINKPLIPSAPSFVVWETTHRCNLKCIHCSAHAGETSEYELSTTEATKTIDKLDDLGVSTIAFSGGEPLLRKDIFQLIRYAADKGIYPSMDTNGTLITKEKAMQMKKSGLKYVRISIDSCSSEKHDQFRGVQGAFQKSINGIKNVVNNFNVSICTTVTKQNYEEVDEIIDLAKSLGVSRVLFDEFIPIGRGEDIEEIDLSPTEREYFLKNLYQKMKNEDVDIIAAYSEITRIALQEDNCKKLAPTYNTNFRGVAKKLLAKFTAGCPVGRSVIKINPNGDINPCSFIPVKIGNTVTDDLKDMWKNNPLLNELRDRNNYKNECGRCKYRDMCGGCRARAYHRYNDYLGPDYGCIYNKKG